MEFYVDERNTSDQSQDKIIAHKTHNVDQFTFDLHPTLLRNWLYITKFTTLQGHLTLYDQDRYLSTIGGSGVPSIFLLCESNNCKKEIEDVKWALDRYKFMMAAFYAFSEKLDDDDELVKRLALVPKPAIFLSHIKNRQVEYFLLKDNVEPGYREAFDEHDVAYFIRKYLTAYHTMVPFRSSEESSDSSFAFKHLKRVTGDNFDQVIAKSSLHWIVLVHEDHKSHQQALHNLNQFAKSFGYLFNQLGFAAYNQLVNVSPIDIVRDVPLMIFIHKGQSHKLKTEGVNGVIVETLSDHQDLEQMFSFLRANYPLKSQLAKFVEISGIEADPNPDGIEDLEEYDAQQGDL